MKKNVIKTLIILLIIVMMPFPAFAMDEDYIPIQIDGYYDDWDDKPHTEVYPGNNPPVNKINYVSLFRDEDFVYVHVIFARKNNQGITNMTIELDTNMGKRSYFLFPDFWFNSINTMDMAEQEMIPEEDLGLNILELAPESENANGTEPDDQGVTQEEETGAESTDQNPDNSESVNETENNILNPHSELDQAAYFASNNDKEKINNGKGKSRWYGTWSFTVWRSIFNWDDWEDWDWDNWEDWEDWDDSFNQNDLLGWNDWFDWDDWSPVGSGYYTRAEGEPDELELYIPLSSITRNYDGITEISMKIKKLGPQIVMCTGAGSGAFAGIGIGAGIALLSVGAYAYKRKRPLSNGK